MQDSFRPRDQVVVGTPLDFRTQRARRRHEQPPQTAAYDTISSSTGTRPRHPCCSRALEGESGRVMEVYDRAGVQLFTSRSRHVGGRPTPRGFSVSRRSTSGLGASPALSTTVLRPGWTFSRAGIVRGEKPGECAPSSGTTCAALRARSSALPERPVECGT